jgi:hypothetical protein
MRIFHILNKTALLVFSGFLIYYSTPGALQWAYAHPYRSIPTEGLHEPQKNQLRTLQAPRQFRLSLLNAKKAMHEETLSEFKKWLLEQARVRLNQINADIESLHNYSTLEDYHDAKTLLAEERLLKTSSSGNDIKTLAAHFHVTDTFNELMKIQGGIDELIEAEQLNKPPSSHSDSSELLGHTDYVSTGVELKEGLNEKTEALEPILLEIKQIQVTLKGLLEKAERAELSQKIIMSQSQVSHSDDHSESGIQNQEMIEIQEQIGVLEERSQKLFADASAIVINFFDYHHWAFKNDFRLHTKSILDIISVSSTFFSAVSSMGVVYFLDDPTMSLVMWIPLFFTSLYASIFVGSKLADKWATKKISDAKAYLPNQQIFAEVMQENLKRMSLITNESEFLPDQVLKSIHQLYESFDADLQHIYSVTSLCEPLLTSATEEGFTFDFSNSYKIKFENNQNIEVPSR